MATDLLATLQQFVESLLSERATAVQYAGDPAGTLAAQGITEHSLTGVDVRRTVAAACASPRVPAQVGPMLGHYLRGDAGQQVGAVPPPPVLVPGPAPVSLAELQQHLNYVTGVVYADDPGVTQFFDRPSHDQSQHLADPGLLFGDVSFDQRPGLLPAVTGGSTSTAAPFTGTGMAVAAAAALAAGSAPIDFGGGATGTDRATEGDALAGTGPAHDGPVPVEPVPVDVDLTDLHHADTLPISQLDQQHAADGDPGTHFDLHQDEPGIHPHEAPMHP
jgi:hypothetical protein